MKKLALAAALSVAATGAFAGSLKPPVMKQPVVVAEAQKPSSALWVVPVLLLVVVAAAIVASN